MLHNNKTSKNKRYFSKSNYFYINSSYINNYINNVIIPVFNRFDLALESLISVIFQDIYYVKVIVVDDASKKDFFCFFRKNSSRLLFFKKNLENYLEKVFNKKLEYIKTKKVKFKFKNSSKKYKKISSKIYKKDLKYVKKIILEIFLLNENKKYIREILFIRNRDNLGPGKSRDIGLRFIYNGIVSFLDSDDLYMPKRLNLVQNYMKEVKNSKIKKYGFENKIFIFVLQNKDFYLYNDKIVNLNKKHFKPSGYIFFDSVKQNRISMPSFSIFKKDLNFIKNFYGENLFSELPVMEDYYFYLKLTFISEVRLIDKNLSIIRKWDNIESQTKKNKNYEYYRLVSIYNFLIKLLIIFNSNLNNNDLNLKEIFLYLSNNKNMLLDEIIFKFNVWLKGSLKRRKYEKKFFVKVFFVIFILNEIF